MAIGSIIWPVGLLWLAVLPASGAELKSLHGMSADAPVASKYILYCGGCHGLDGKGEVEADVPMLPPNVGAFLYDPDGAWYLVNVGGVMSAGISDADAADILNYIIDQFGKRSAPQVESHTTSWFSAQQVGELRARPPADLVNLRKKIATRLAEKGIDLPADYPWN